MGTPTRRYIDRYADGNHISAARRQKAEILGERLAALFPRGRDLEVVDFGCADGAVPVLLLRSPAGDMIRRLTGITLLDYNDLPEKPAHAHPRFRRLIADLASPLDSPRLPWGQCDAVLATAFFHYFAQPEVPFAHAYRLLKPGGYLLAGLPARWVLRVRKHGLPGLLPPNTRIRQIQSLAAWQSVASAVGFTEHSAHTIQWLSNYLVVYQKPSGELTSRRAPGASSG